MRTVDVGLCLTCVRYKKQLPCVGNNTVMCCDYQSSETSTNMEEK
jgi:hypothetical protein